MLFNPSDVTESEICRYIKTNSDVRDSFILADLAKWVIKKLQH